MRIYRVRSSARAAVLHRDGVRLLVRNDNIIIIIIAQNYYNGCPVAVSIVTVAAPLQHHDCTSRVGRPRRRRRWRCRPERRHAHRTRPLAPGTAHRSTGRPMGGVLFYSLSLIPPPATGSPSPRRPKRDTRTAAPRAAKRFHFPRRRRVVRRRLAGGDTDRART